MILMERIQLITLLINGLSLGNSIIDQNLYIPLLIYLNKIHQFEHMHKFNQTLELL